jgi:serine phosphatase RsbU (regulator of sigma subunit)/anti-sigma regulatory factor (Ser/Thr protein kinase)
MTTLRAFWRNRNKKEETMAAAAPHPAAPELAPAAQLDLDIAPNDPLLAYLQHVNGVVEVDRLTLDSPAVAALKAAGVKLIVPLVSQGELIGLINLGVRLSEQEYSSDDRKLLGNLATQAAPALRVAQLVQQQKVEAAERERMEQELRVARLIQQTLLPQEVPDVSGWQVSAYYQPAREVGGDFYDFIYFPDGKIGFIVADVTDKGVPAALVMATTRSILRAAAERLESPGAVLERTNEVLHKEIPPRMFVTCFYAILDPATGHLQYANAGHDVPYRRTADGVVELRATGMPLGLLPGMGYEEKEATLDAGDSVLLYSDGLVEAHAPDGDMFGFPRLQALLALHPGGEAMTDFLLDELAAFTGQGWEQEDDVTMVVLSRSNNVVGDGSQLRYSFQVPSAPGNERQAMEQVAEIVAPLQLETARLEKLKTAVAEATMNAMEHGNKYQADVPVQIEIVKAATELLVRITDQGGGSPAEKATEAPDLLAKLSGEQSPRGWGLFLIKNMVDEMHVHQDEQQHTVELVLHLTDEENVS